MTHSDSRGRDDRRAPGPSVCGEVCLLIENRSPEWPRTGAPFSKAEDGSAGLCLARPGGILVLSPFRSSGGFGGHYSVQKELQGPLASHSAYLLPSGRQNFFNIPEKEGGTETFLGCFASRALEGTPGQARVCGSCTGVASGPPSQEAPEHHPSLRATPH